MWKRRQKAHNFSKSHFDFEYSPSTKNTFCNMSTVTLKNTLDISLWLQKFYIIKKSQHCSYI